MAWARWILLLLAVSVALPARATPIAVDASARETVLWPHLELLEDPRASSPS